MLFLLLILFLLLGGLGFTLHVLWIGAVVAFILLVARALLGGPYNRL